ncbi:MAG: HpcH/HpaI aldolase/citrate lyase family protein [Psychroflexus sp.]
MKNFFFVPGTRLHKIDAIEELNVSEIIIDLEDAVKFSDRELIIEKLISDDNLREFYIRIPLYSKEAELDSSIFEELYKNGFRKFIFPKIQKASDFEKLCAKFKSDNISIILLVETTRFFLEVQSVLLKHREFISGIAIGSHDFMAQVGGRHNLKNLEYIRLHVLYLARMINVEAVDIASMELKNENKLKKEILDGFEKGYDAKFYIHPWQIKVKENILLYSKLEYQWALKIKAVRDEVENRDEFNPIVIDDQIIERAHLNKAEKIIEYYETK